MQKATSIFYGLSIFLLMTAFFVLQPSKVSEVAALQSEIKQQFSVAWQQTIGDSSYFSELEIIFDGVASFYDQASGQTLALLTQPDTDEALHYVFYATYQNFAQIFQPKQVYSAQNLNLPDLGRFMSEQAIYNIVPDTSKTLIYYNEPVNNENSWVTIQDNFTGQIYCLAIYNGEVNKYLGSCKNEYH